MTRGSSAILCIAFSLGAQTALADNEQVLAKPGVEQETPSQPEAERSYRLEWHYKRVHWAEGVTAGVLGVTAIATSSM